MFIENLDKLKKDSNGFIDIIGENIKSKLKWEKCLRVPLATKYFF